jgi:uncharacterized repeat protein (TIGR01451 family)
MNSAGKVAYYTWVGDPMGFLWDSLTGTNTQLAAGPAGPDSSIYQVARDINDVDDVVGRSSPPSATGGISHALRWQGEVVTDLGSGLGEAVAIGNGGQIVLSSGNLWDNGLLTNMGAFTPADVNSSVVVVGSQQVAGSPHAVAWQGGALSDLNDLIPAGSGWVLQSATRISDSGYIIGTGTLNGQSRGFLLVPDTITPAQADLTVTASQSPPGNYVSGPITVTFTVINNGAAAATGATLVANFRPYQFTTFPTILPSQGSCLTNAWNDQYVADPTAYTWCGLGTLAPGASATVQLTANSTADTTLGASAHAIEIDTNTADNQASHNITKASADLSVVVSDAPDPVQTGQPLTYTAVLTNNGPEPAGNAHLRSSTPAGTTHVWATPSAGTCSGTSLVDCSFGDLAAGGSVSVQIVVTPTATGTVSRTFLGLSSSTDPNSANNNAAASTTVVAPAPSADLSLTLADSPDPVTVGGTVTYTATVTNNGPDTATNVTVSGSLPDCTFASIASGASAACTRTATAASAGTLTQTMSVSATETDPDSGNNTATASTTVNAPTTDLAVTMTDSPDPVKKGAKLTYNIVVSNVSSIAASGAALNVALPSNSIFVSRSTTQGTCSGTTTVCCNFGSIAAGGSVNVTIKVKPTVVGTATSTATVSNTSPADSNSANNTATATTTVKR